MYLPADSEDTRKKMPDVEELGISLFCPRSRVSLSKLGSEGEEAVVILQPNLMSFSGGSREVNSSSGKFSGCFLVIV